MLVRLTTQRIAPEFFARLDVLLRLNRYGVLIPLRFVLWRGISGYSREENQLSRLLIIVQESSWFSALVETSAAALVGSYVCSAFD